MCIQRPWFRKYFPVFMKYITGGYVGEEEAGQRLGQGQNYDLYTVCISVVEYCMCAFIATPIHTM